MFCCPRNLKNIFNIKFVAFNYIVKWKEECYIVNKNNKKIFVVLTLLILLIVLILGYTYSKYKQSVQVSTKSTIAKWSFAGSVSNTKNSSTETTISLADTVESDKVKEQRIAPGTKGEFNIVIDATGSEVDLDYDVLISSETHKPTNLYFLYNGEKYTTLSSLIEKVNEDNTKEFSGTIKHNESSQIVTYTIGWDWPYETIIDNVIQDESDLQDALNDISDYVFTLMITGIQAQ